jgi:hypothetical protein
MAMVYNNYLPGYTHAVGPISGQTTATAVYVGEPATNNWYYTPVSGGSGRVVITVNADISMSQSGAIDVMLFTGTGTAPGQGTTVSGTNVGPVHGLAPYGAYAGVPTTWTFTVTGLSQGVQYWLDFAVYSSNTTGGTVYFANPSAFIADY